MPKISELTTVASPLSTDTIPLVEGGVTQKATLASLPLSDAEVTALALKASLTGAETLTNKTIAAPVLSGTATGTYTLGGTPTITAPVLTGTTDVTGGQLKFPATQVASANGNTLDDYEEGGWSPTLTSGVGTLTSAGFSAAVYTKIGNLVVCCFRCTITTNGTGSASLIFSVPFTSVTSAVGSFREAGVTGKMGSATVTGSTVTMYLYDNSYPGGDGHIIEGTVTFLV
jgi:hypothetical protein